MNKNKNISMEKTYDTILVKERLCEGGVNHFLLIAHLSMALEHELGYIRFLEENGLDEAYFVINGTAVCWKDADESTMDEYLERIWENMQDWLL